MEKNIVIKGAKENNLKNVDLTIPKDSLVVFTGLSGSGKTTLAFDTIFAEGQRRYMESLSSYARQFLGNFNKPDVDSIDGLSPSIAIDQKSVSHNPRSTVGTVTEIYDYLRLLYGRIGIPYCPVHQEPIISFSISQMTDIVFSYPIGTKIQLLAPVVIKEKGTQKDVIEKIKTQGYLRLRVDGQFVDIDEVKELDKNKKHSIDVVVDRIIVKENIRSRVFESIETVLDLSNGLLIIYSENEERMISDKHTCPICGFSIPKIEPRLFSFNSPLGYCEDCKGLGIKKEVDVNILVPDPSKTINQGCIKYFAHQVGGTNLEWQEFKILCELYNVRMDVSWNDLTQEEKEIVLIGSKKEHKYSLKSSSGNTNNRFGFIEGVKTRLERLYNGTTSEMMRDYYGSFMKDTICTTCHGARLSDKALSVKVDDKNIFEATSLQIKDLDVWIVSLPKKLSKTHSNIADLVLKEIHNRLQFLINVGLDYLTLSRMALTLSGGESQRIRLATQIGSKLTGVLYVMDEPSIGLHPRDSAKLIEALKQMRDLGNTLIVVEHDEETIKSADFIVDVGPGAGIHGGKIVAAGDLRSICANKESITGQYLSGKKFIPIPSSRKSGNGNYLRIKGAFKNNLKNIDVDIPLGCFVAITGVSGSGKSSLINQTLYPYIKEKVVQRKEIDVDAKSILGVENIDKVINITQDPIGRTPRSNPATYVKLFDEIRDIFASTIEAKARGYDKGRFSFNVAGGRCETCWGDGVVKIPMNFLPDVYVKCETCQGKRYNEETLQVTYKGKSIYDVLEMTIDEAYDFFESRPSLRKKLELLKDVGLGYIKLGQSATTLSGGEAQRIKLSLYLQKKSTGRTLYILDEPTTGLHTDDVSRLIKVLQRIVEHGDSVLVIEHNLDVIKVADYIIDLGPKGGDEGGRIVAVGTPEEITKNPKSQTGYYLKSCLRKD